jgi:sugar/nucleoside kinase (ribokinase family)
VVGGGNFIVDYVKTIDHYPAEQTLADIHGEFVGSGGAPYNVLRCLAELDPPRPLHAIGRVGDDAAGTFILEDCGQRGIDVSRLRATPGVPTSYTLVMVAGNKRTFFHQRGANALLAPDDFDFTGLNGSHFHYGYLLLLDAMDGEDSEYGTGAARVLAEAKEAGLTTSVDVVSEDSDRFRNIVPTVVPYADLIFMNEFEAARTIGASVVQEGRVIQERVAEVSGFIGGAGTLVLHWAEGSAACVPGRDVVWHGCVDIPYGKIASVTGAGDAFAAGYLVGYLRGELPEACLRQAACAAAASVTAFTCTDGVGSLRDCLALGDEHGFRACP